MTIPWSNNWDKSYRISVGTREYTKSLYTVDEGVTIPSSIARPASEADSVTIPSDAISLSNLLEDGNNKRGFTFRFEYSNKLSSKGGDAENSTLTLFNPSEELIDILNKDKCVVIVELGYEQLVELEYSGDVVQVQSRKSGEDVIYQVKCSSGGLAMRNTVVNLNYDESVSEADVIRDMATRFPSTALASHGLDDLENRYRSGGKNFSGSLVTNFDNFLRKRNLKYVYELNKIVIVPYRLKGKGQSMFERTNYNFTSDNIKLVTDITKRDAAGSDDVKSKLRTLTMNTFYTPVFVGQFVTIPDDEYLEDFAGTYQIEAKRVIAETTKNGGWDTVLTLKELP